MPSTKAPTTTPLISSKPLQEELARFEIGMAEFWPLWINGWVKQDLIALAKLLTLVANEQIDPVIQRHFDVGIKQMHTVLCKHLEHIWTELHDILDMDELGLPQRVYALRCLVAFSDWTDEFTCEPSIWLDRFSKPRFDLCVEVLRRDDHDAMYAWALHEASAMFTHPEFEAAPWEIDVRQSRVLTDCYEAALERALDRAYKFKGLYELLTISTARTRMHDSFEELWS